MAQRVVASLAVIAAACVAASWPATAAAELIDDADRLIEIYREREAEAWRAATLFLTEGEARRVGLEPAPGRCVTVVAMGTRRTEMVLRGPGRRPAESSAGIVEVTDCSGELKFVDLTLRSERGAVEVIVAAHDEPLPAVAEVDELVPLLTGEPGVQRVVEVIRPLRVHGHAAAPERLDDTRIVGQRLGDPAGRDAPALTRRADGDRDASRQRHGR